MPRRRLKLPLAAAGRAVRPMKSRVASSAVRLLRSGLSAGHLLAVWFIVCALFASACRTEHLPEIYVHFPQSPEDLQVPAVGATFVLGNVQPAGSTLTINGKPARVRANGAFLEYVSLAPGDFVVHFEAKNRAGTSVVDLPLRVAARPTPEENMGEHGHPLNI